MFRNALAFVLASLGACLLFAVVSVPFVPADHLGPTVEVVRTLVEPIDRVLELPTPR